MASALIHGDRDRSQVVSHGKKPPSPLDQGSKTPIPRSSEAKKRLNSSDGASSRQLASATKVPTASGCKPKSATKQRPSDILNPKTVDPVSKAINNQLTKASNCHFFVLHQWFLHAKLTKRSFDSLLCDVTLVVMSRS